MEEVEDPPSSPSLRFLSAIVRCAFVEDSDDVRCGDAKVLDMGMLDRKLLLMGNCFTRNNRARVGEVGNF